MKHTRHNTAICRSDAMTSPQLSAHSEHDLLEANRVFYDALWARARLIRPEHFNTWPLVTSLVSQSPRRLEVAPGLRPRLPIKGTHFVDISVPALNRLRDSGGSTAVGLVTALPFPDTAFDLVCALDIVEHVDDDGALRELSRVIMPGGALLLSMPLHQARWTVFDEIVGHRRRYEPEALLAKLAAHGLPVASSAVFGMQPKSSRITRWGMWWLTHQRERAMWWYNRAMPFVMRFGKRLTVVPGMVDTTDVDGVLLVCSKSGERAPDAAA